MITGVTRTYAQTMREVRRVIDHAEGKTRFGMHIWVGQQQTIFIADSTVNERPSAEMLADIDERTAQVARRMGHEPRVAFLSYSTFGNPPGYWRSEEHTSELQSLLSISYAVFFLNK